MDCTPDIISPLGFFFVLAGSILPAASKRKGQINHGGLHILPRGMHNRRTAIPDASTQDQATETGLAFVPLMR
jgi:hypothetical protein